MPGKSGSSANSEVPDFGPANAMLPRKAVDASLGVPVPKPTQVGEESILRRSREPWLRNSAK